MEKPESSPSPRQVLYATPKEWNRFLSVFLLAAGVGFTVSGILFFFAYNWNGLPEFAKLGIVEALLTSFVLLAVFTRWNRLVKQVLLTGAVFLTGTLFAVFGQIYQTGADAYDLFLGWTLFTVLWVAAVRFAPLWLIFIGLLCTTIWLYNIQIAGLGSWESTLLANAVTWICALATAVTVRMRMKGRLDKQNRWLEGFLSLATIAHTGFLTMLAISNFSFFRTGTACEGKMLLISLLSTVLIFSTGLWFGWKEKNLFYPAVIPFMALMILLTAFIRYSELESVNLFFFAGTTVISGTTLLIYVILRLKKKWYGTEA